MENIQNCADTKLNNFFNLLMPGSDLQFHDLLTAPMPHVRKGSVPSDGSVQAWPGAVSVASAALLKWELLAHLSGSSRGFSSVSGTGN